MQQIRETIASELGCRAAQAAAAIDLLDSGATVPFIARYRKEATGGLDDTALRTLEERLRYLRELEERREQVLRSIREQQKLTPQLEAAIQAADTRTRLEDLYLPYRPRRRTRAQMAREAGLEPLAQGLLEDPTRDPASMAAEWLNEEQGIATAEDALNGARQILMEQFSEDADLLPRLRNFLWERARIRARVQEGEEKKGDRFRDWFDHEEPLAKIPSHRALALFRGRREGVLRVTMTLPDELEQGSHHPCVDLVTETAGWQHQRRPADDWLADVMRGCWRIRLQPRMETELLGQVRERAETEAIQVFARNLRSLLMAAPAGPRTTLGLDPGLRTGVKAVVVDGTGKLLEHATLYPHAPKKQWDASRDALAALCARHNVELVAIGNGTAGRETQRLVREMMAGFGDRHMDSVMVNEAGASVYSASEAAAREFPDLDVSFRGAVSIARRLQDPLAELVRIEPKSIGVGQYQHDVSQVQLARSLDAVVEDCVNAVGVDVNTASAPLLARIAGLNTTVAENIVRWRDSHGAFRSRRDLRDVPRLGEKTFEQAAGFLRVMNGTDPLDASAVHPEAYPVVERIAAETGRPLESLIGDEGFLASLDPERYTDEHFGLPTVMDILSELRKPGRDPRPEFRTPEFREDVESIEDLRPGMILEGAVSNVTNFGAFVDLGVHQDGLVHVSALSSKFIRDPHEVVAPGDSVRVKVLEVDRERKRISLTMRLDDAHQGEEKEKEKEKKTARPGKSGGRKRARRQSGAKGKPGRGESKPEGAMAAAFARARGKDSQESPQ